MEETHPFVPLPFILLVIRTPNQNPKINHHHRHHQKQKEKNPMVEPLEPVDLTFLDLLDQNPPPKTRQNPSSLAIPDELLDSSVGSAVTVSSPAKDSSANELFDEEEEEEEDEEEEEEEEEELEWLSNKDAFPSVETSHLLTSCVPPPPLFKVPVKARSKIRRKRRRIFERMSGRMAKGERTWCRHCETEETPQWRMGPEGPRTLCNACGVRFKKGRLFPEYRPASSPTFSEGVHSNSTRRVMEMRMGMEKGRKRTRVLM